MMTKELRDDLLVTLAMRVAYMDCKDKLNLPYGVIGEEIIAQWCAEVVAEWDCLDSEGEDICYDEFIEEEILREWGKEREGK